MVKSVYTNRYSAIRSLLIAERNAAGLTQQALADKLGRPQSYVSKFELGERRLDVVEFLDVLRSIGVEPVSFLKKLENFVTNETQPRKRR
jgi:transcriptional regulator with XRE-family HTH domain